MESNVESSISSASADSSALLSPGLNVQEPRNMRETGVIYVPGKQQAQIPSLSSGKKFVFGLVLVCSIACSWVGSTQTAKSAYTNDFRAPFFSMWFGTAWMIILFPLIVPIYLIQEKKNLDKLWKLVFILYRLISDVIDSSHYSKDIKFYLGHCHLYRFWLQSYW